jgi:hypothetical protein
MTHAQKPDFVFRRNGGIHLNRRGVGWGFSSFVYWHASCTHQPAGFVLLVQACVLQSCDAYCLPIPFASFPFTSPPMRHRVPSHFKRTLPTNVAAWVSFLFLPPFLKQQVYPLVVILVQWDFRHIIYVYCAITKTLAPWAVFK